jgi:hypothetical protein
MSEEIEAAFPANLPCGRAPAPIPLFRGDDFAAVEAFALQSLIECHLQSIPVFRVGVTIAEVPGVHHN